MEANCDAVFRCVSVIALLSLGASSCTSDKAPAPGRQEGVSAISPAPTFDPLDALPAQMGDLKLIAAWRVAAAEVVQLLGKYQWQAGAAGLVDLTCTLPRKDEAECDSGLPSKLRLGNVKACAATSDDQESRTGPLISWPSCILQMAYGQGGKRRFEQLKKAAADGIPWTQKVLAWTEGTADNQAIKRNREAGLLLASQRGNDQVPSLSHQLDPR